VLTERYLERYADVLIWGLRTARRERFRKGNVILIQYDRAALRLAEILYDRLVAMGMNPVQRIGLTVAMERSFFRGANGAQLVFQAPGEKELCANINGRIFLHAPDSLTHLKDVDPARIGKAIVARKPLRDILEKREQEGDYGWTLCTLPTPELAMQARTTPELYTEQIIRACYLDRRDPVGEWKTIRRDATAIKQWLSGLKAAFFHIESERCDLRITPGAQRKWAGVSGHNIPSYRSGNYVEGVRLTFVKGTAIKISAEKGEAFTAKQLRMDRGAARIGEFSLTDRRFSRIDRFMADTLFDENFGGKFGNCHIALGSSYADTYAGDPALLTKELKQKLGFNDSALHWDLVNTENKTVTAHLTTGERIVIYENGRFRY
jgi:aminopeptidase